MGNLPCVFLFAVKQYFKKCQLNQIKSKLINYL